ncbi:unnamed protein product [Strongylus vulgaris]|uniref:Uncharacterized protein n=1 Tax=Strongylus vulgaris TaxID=40348 RepID=A0A3P7JQL9_STRVU|nr:unnamed protein product [Strongylus vulgaris]
MCLHRLYRKLISEEPTIAVESEPHAVPLAHAHVAPIAPAVPVAPVAPLVASVSAVPLASVWDYHHMFPYNHYYHPRSAIHNVAKSYAKETGHASATSVVSESGHLPHSLGLHLPNLANSLFYAEPWKSRLHHQKAAKKILKIHKAVNTKTH